MKACDHRYRKFNESNLFCTRCGTTKAVSVGFHWTYPYRQPTPWPWTPFTPWWSVTTGSLTDVTYHVWNDTAGTASTTYTLSAGELHEEGPEEPDTTPEPEGREGHPGDS